MMTSDEHRWYLEAIHDVIRADASQRCELVTKLCDRLILDEIDFDNPVCMLVEHAISLGFESAYVAEDYRTALRFAEGAATVAARCPDFAIGRARTANNRALALMELGDFVAASALFEEGLRLIEGQDDPFGLAATIKSNFSAMQSMRAAGYAAFAIPNGVPARRGSLSALNNQAAGLMQAKRFEEARDVFLSLLSDSEVGDIKIRATLLSNLASAQLGLGVTSDACSTLEQAISECEKAGYSGQVLAGILLEYGRLLINQEGPDAHARAGNALKHAWDIIRPIALHSRQTLLILSGLARIRIIQGDLARACACLERGMNIYDDMRARIGRTEDDLSGVFEIYRQLVELRLWIVPGRDSPLDGALLIQKAKVRYWSEFLAKRHEASPAQDDAGLVSDDDFISLIGFAGMMLEFFVGPNATFVCLIQNRHIAIYRIDVTENELEEQVNAVCKRLSQGLSAIRPLKTLSSTLFSSLDVPGEHVRAILVAPDGPLWRLPFSLLKLGQRDVTLGDMAPCFCIPSASVLAQMRRQRISSGPRLGLVVAHTEGAPGLLSGADDECRFVRDAMSCVGDVRILGKFDGADGAPTLVRVLGLLGEATHIHFLAHAVGGNEEEESHLLLSAEDGSAYAHLSASQIATLPLRAEVVVLATCESSLGRVQPGEGLASLARAFLLAGVRCVIATLWEVENRSAREFFRLYYAYIAGGDAPARSYRRAKRDYEAQYGQDATSAGIIVLGDADCDADRQDLRYLQPHLNTRDRQIDKQRSTT